MPVDKVVYLLIAILGVAVLSGRPRLHPFLAMVLAASAFGVAVSLSVGLVARDFGDGFAETLASVGLVIVAAAIINAIAEQSGASARLAAAFGGWRQGWRLPALMVPLGLVAGIAASPAAAFAVLSPIRQALAAGSRRANAVSAIALGLAISASHGMVLPAPCAIAASAILAADPFRVLAFALPTAAILGLLGAAFAYGAARGILADAAEPDGVPSAAPAAGARHVAAMLLPAVAMILLLMVQSIGQIPSEPLGGGPTREMLLGAGRPAVLLAVGVGISLLLTWRWDAIVISERGWVGQAIAGTAGLLLMVGAGGGLQKLIQETGLAELMAERMLDWRIGLLLPFLVAALLKFLQGSSLVAAITTAGMIEPMLAPLGLASENGRALTVVAIGAGAMTLSHINDGYFWLVTGSARLTPARGLALFTGGTLLQGLVAVAILLAIGTAVG